MRGGRRNPFAGPKAIDPALYRGTHGTAVGAERGTEQASVGKRSTTRETRRRRSEHQSRACLDVSAELVGGRAVGLAPVVQDRDARLGTVAVVRADALAQTRND